MPKYSIPIVTLNPNLNVYPDGSHPGAASLTAVDADLINVNIIAGKTIFGVAGVMVPKVEVSFPAVIALVDTEAIVPVDQSYNKNAPITSEHKQAYDDAPADYIKRLTPTVALSKTHVIVPVNQSYNKNAPVGSEGGVWVTPAVGGAVLDDGGVQTDYTTEINNATANDVPLLPVAPLVVNDAFYFGLGQLWDQLWLNIGTAGVGNYALAHEYWNGAWVALAGVIDKTSEFTIAGTNNIKWTRPGDWALTTILGMNLYWIRARVTEVVTYTTQPLGTQGWCEVLV